MQLSKDQVRSIMMCYGFTIKEGQTDMKPYVYEAIEAVVKAEMQILSDKIEDILLSS